MPLDRNDILIPVVSCRRNDASLISVCTFLFISRFPLSFVPKCCLLSNQVVFYAAVFRAIQSLKAFDEEVESALSKSQLGPLRDMVACCQWVDFAYCVHIHIYIYVDMICHVSDMLLNFGSILYTVDLCDYISGK